MKAYCRLVDFFFISWASVYEVLRSVCIRVHDYSLFKHQEHDTIMSHNPPVARQRFSPFSIITVHHQLHPSTNFPLLVKGQGKSRRIVTGSTIRDAYDLRKLSLFVLFKDAPFKAVESAVILVRYGRKTTERLPGCSSGLQPNEALRSTSFTVTVLYESTRIVSKE